MTYGEFRSRTRFDTAELLAFARGGLIADPPAGFAARLPLPPLLMVDRIVDLGRDGARGRIVAERDVRASDWFFECHFVDDPVQPGCLGLDAVWQLLGFFCTWAGGLGSGRALGVGEVEFFGQIRPHDALVRYEVDVVRYSELRQSGSSIAIGDAVVLVDGEAIYSIKRAKTGLFRGIAYRGYPNLGPNARGGKIEP